MTTAPDTAPAVTIDPSTTIGAVHLTVPDLERSRDFYERALGLTARERDDGTVGLDVAGGAALVVLHADAGAGSLDRRAPGLYHLAILFPDRRSLAVALARLAAFGWALDGASDHLVSEALYLSDPDGNGIELYHDRPREQWRYRDGQLQMATLPLDLDDLLAQLGGERATAADAPAGTMIGHVHLQVASIEEAEAFYSGVLGFEVMVRGYPGALFVAAGGYHHHLGLNTWHSAGAPPASPGSVGLERFEIVLPSEAAREHLLERVRAAGIEVADTGAGPLVRDPFGNGVSLQVG